METKHDGPGNVTITLLGVVEREYGEENFPLPEGLMVTVEPAKFVAYKNQIYASLLKVETLFDLEKGDYHLRLSIIFETEFIYECLVLIKVK